MQALAPLIVAQCLAKRFALSTAELGALALAPAASAATLSYTVDPTLSSLQFAVYIFGAPPDGTLLTAPQTPGSDITSLGGTLLADVGVGTINFPGGSAISFANQPVDQLPEPGGGPALNMYGSPAPAQYGLSVILIDSGPLALRNLLADVTSSVPIALLAGSFNSAGTSLGTVTGDADYNLDGLAPAFGTSSLAGQSGPNSTGVGTVTVAGPLTTITIPIFVDVPLVVNNIPLDAIFTGQIVATNIVPEPSSLVLACFGLLGLAAVARSRRKS